MNQNSIIYPLKAFTEQNDMVINNGKGCYLYDEQGKKYLDGISGLWNVSFGHSNPKILDAVKKQMENLSYVNMISFTAPIVTNYANGLIRLLQKDFSKMFYACSGSEAVEIALKVARKYQRLKGFNNKSKIGIFDMSYHGTTYGAMSASGIDQVEVKAYAPLVGGFTVLNTPFFPEVNEMPDDSLKEQSITRLKKELDNGADEIAAVLLEPVIGSGGIIPIPDWYMKELVRICNEKQILLIFDEVATGFGRTGNIMDYMDIDVKPDMLCLSKAINNGMMGMGALLISKNIEDLYLSKNGYIEHFSTQNGNPLACAAGNVVLEMVSESGFLESVREKGAYLQKELNETLNGSSSVREIRGKGMMIGIDLIDNQKRPISWNALRSLEQQMQKKGLLLYPYYLPKKTSGFSLFPTFDVTTKDLDKIVQILAKMLK